MVFTDKEQIYQRVFLSWREGKKAYLQTSLTTNLMIPQFAASNTIFWGKQNKRLEKISSVKIVFIWFWNKEIDRRNYLFIWHFLFIKMFSECFNLAVGKSYLDESALTPAQWRLCVSHFEWPKRCLLRYQPKGLAPSTLASCGSFFFTVWFCPQKKRPYFERKTVENEEL